MNRTEFNTAYREARVTLKLMAAWPSRFDRYRGEYVTREQQRAAEAKWISWQKIPRMDPVLKAVHGSLCRDKSTISNAALHDFRFCGGHLRDWYLDMARRSRGILGEAA